MRSQSASGMWVRAAKERTYSDRFVHSSLHERLGWTAAHEKCAEMTLEAFRLRYPRDKELCRQLAFVYVRDGVNPFEAVPRSAAVYLDDKTIEPQASVTAGDPS